MSTTTLPYRTYAENIRAAAKAKRLNIRDLATRLGFSYEHIRKIWMGHTPKRKDRFTVGEECSNLLCDLLGLPKAEMFELAKHEKFAQRNGYAPVQLPDPLGQELADLWGHLGDEQKQILLRMGHSFANELAHAS